MKGMKIMSEENMNTVHAHTPADAKNQPGLVAKATESRASAPAHC